VRQDVLMAVNVYRASIIDYSPDALSIEVTGAPSKIDAFIELMRPFGIIEMCRTGLVAINRGSSTIFKDGQ
jgi:acetolactate synthase-1/3 small subunit